MKNQLNDIALLALTRHRSPNGATHTKLANAQSQDLTPFPNAAIAVNQIISVSGVRYMYILNPGFLGIQIFQSAQKCWRRPSLYA